MYSKNTENSDKVSNSFRLKPVAAAIRIAMTGMLFGSMTQVAHSELPVAAPNWVGSGSATKAVQGNTMNIHQATDKVVLNWQKFNIGAQNTVNFSQPGRTSIAINKIGDSNPSKIMGTLRANGQVYLINHNGFIFGERSVIDTNTFVASVLNITQEAIDRGITRVFDETGGAAFEMDATAAANLQVLKQVLIEKGAKITSAEGGRVIIIAPNIENKGDIRAGKQGQIILAASQDKVYLQQADPDKDGFAGLLVEVDTGGKVSNMGEILARQGNVTLEGFIVNQQGRVNATTSVKVGGSIRLLAREGHARQGNKLVATKTTRQTDRGDGLGKEAKLTFKTGSKTTVSLDDSDGVTIDEQFQPDSYLQFAAKTIEMEGGSKVIAHSADVEMVATDNMVNPLAGNDGGIIIHKDSVLDVSGVKNVTVAMDSQVVEVEARSNELRDSPFQRGGILDGKKLKIDTRKGTKLVDTQGAEARIKRGVAERSTKGGQIDMLASAKVEVKKGARIDISGGSVNYQSGKVTTTYLKNEAGQLVEISDADPTDHYVEIVEIAHFEQGYSDGKDAGTLAINTQQLDWQGNLNARAANGIRQRNMENRAKGGRLLIDTTAFNTRQDFLFNQGSGLSVLSNSGLQEFVLKTYGDIQIQSAMNFIPATVLNMEAGSIRVFGQIATAGGEVNLAARKNSLNPSGELIVNSGAQIDVSGRWVNDLSMIHAGRTPVEPLTINGGKIKLGSEGDLRARQGASIKADGGAHFDAKQNLTAGDAGEIILAATGAGSTPSLLYLDAGISARGINKNGKLTLQSNQFILGNQSYTDTQNKINYLSSFSDIFSSFSDITLDAAFGNVMLTELADINLTQQNYQLGLGYRSRSSTGALSSFSHLYTQTADLRSVSNLHLKAANNVIAKQGSSIVAENESMVSMTARNSIYMDGEISSRSGQVDLKIKSLKGVEFDNRQVLWLGKHASVNVSGTSEMDSGTIYRTGRVLKGGAINLDAERGYVLLENDAQMNVSGSAAVLDVPNDAGAVSGYHRALIGSDGGSIRIKAAEGMVVAGKMKADSGLANNRAGAFYAELDRRQRGEPDVPIVPFPNNPLVFNVSQQDKQNLLDTIVFGDALDPGFTGKAEVYAANLTKAGFDSVTLKTPDDINFAGNVDLLAGTFLRLDASSFSVTNAMQTPVQVNLSADYMRLGSSFKRQAMGPVRTGSNLLTAQARYLDLQGALKLNDFEQVKLTAQQDMRLTGNRFGAQRDFLGELLSSANLDLTAAMIYPSSLTDYAISVVGKADSRIQIASTAQQGAMPLSAGGQLTLEADHIVQGGVLRAPLGKIRLQAAKSIKLTDGSITSVSAEGSLIPLGIVQGGLDWMYPLDIVRNLVLNMPPEKRIVLKADEIEKAEGSLVDLAGGGDIFAYEFLAGRGGSSDYLQPGSDSYQNSFAILPSLGSQYAPVDHFQSADFNFAPGETVVLKGGNGIPAGEYAKLPAHYALLPGAFLVTPVAGSQDQTSASRTLDGRPVVSGYNAIASTGKRDARTSAFLVENGSQVRQHSEYKTFIGDVFFTARAKSNETDVPLLAKDSGQISILAKTRLILDGLFKTGTESGRGARMDIAADNIEITDQLSQQTRSGVLQILADNLSKLNIASLLLGGERHQGNNKGETNIAVSSQTVTIKDGADLDVSDLIVTATDSVTVESGARLAATQKLDSGDKQLNIDGDGALLRVSGSSQVNLNRQNTTGQKGVLTVAKGATLEAAESMLLDSSQSTRIKGKMLMSGGSLNLAANNINIGEVTGQGAAENALNLSNAGLGELRVDELILTSRDAINFYGTTAQIDASGIFKQATGGGFQPVQISKVVFDAAGFNGLAGPQGNGSVNLKVDQLALKNTGNRNVTQSSNGTGVLNIEANEIQLQQGNFDIAGFNRVNLTANKQLQVSGQGQLSVAADTLIKTTLVTAQARSNYTIDSRGFQAEFTSTGNSFQSTDPQLAGGLNIKADQLLFDTAINMASGRLALEAITGDVIIGPQAQIDLSGRASSFADQQKYSAGGILTAKAWQGDIYFDAASLVNLNGGDNQTHGGQLNLQARQGKAILNGSLSAKSGVADIDIAGYQQPEAADSLFNKLAAAGIDQSIRYRSRINDITIASATEIKARQVMLTADQGSITLVGKVIADAVDNAQVSLNAADELILENGALISARTESDGAGGKVVLSSIDADKDGISGISTKQGSSIKVGNKQGKQGEVVLRALRDDQNQDGVDEGINIKELAGNVSGYEGRTQTVIEETANSRNVTHYKEGHRFYAEGVKVYQDSNGFITAVDINQYRSDAAAYMTDANRQSVAAGLNQDLQLRPGIVIESTGDMRIASKLDTVNWRYASLNDSQSSRWVNGIQETVSTQYDAITGQLTLRSGGDLWVDNSISDGFKDGAITGQVEYFGFFYPINTQVKDKLQAGDSWSFNLVAGADLNSADVTGLKQQGGSITLGNNTQVRTGSGNLGLYAADDVVFSDQTAVVYNAGRADSVSPYGTLSKSTLAVTSYSEFPVSGGDINIRAGGNVKGAESDQFVNNWLLRQGDWSKGDATSWGVALGYTPQTPTNAAYSNKPLFEQNIGSFGGGNVSVLAKGDITDLSIMMPTTGKQVGEPDPDNPIGFLTNEVEINGGGQMLIQAGGNIAGGVYLLGKGTARLSAGGDITGGQQYTKGPLLSLGDTRADLQAGGDIHLSSVTDPMIVHNKDVNFFSYSDSSAINVVSTGGGIYLGADDSELSKLLRYSSKQSTLARVYPASLNAVALSGDIVLNNSVVLFPSNRGELNILAKKNIKSVSNIQQLGMSDADRSLLPSMLQPVARNNMTDTIGRINPFGIPQMVHAATPVHQGDSSAVTVVAQQGDIERLSLNVPKKARIQTGTDLVNSIIKIQHVDKEDVSVISAGRDVKFTSERDQSGTLLTNKSVLEVAGPGDVLITTGRNLDLGASEGIVTIGDVANPALDDRGANVTLLVGAGRQPDYLGFVQQMKSFKQSNSDNEITRSEFFKAIDSLDVEELARLEQLALNKQLLPLFFKALKTGGAAESRGNTQGNELGYQAIDSLFSGSKWQGDLKLFFSRIHTVDGGDINLAVPGGEINAGLAVSFSGAKSPDKLGIVAQRQGAINAYLKDDFQVNQSRVMTLGGGDILAWSGEGDIDAGKGAKSAISAPPPIITFDEKGNMLIEFPPVVSGSGIRTAASGKTQAGDVYLFAPKGIIDAGEAGIGGNNVTVVAKAILGGSNIDVGGVGTGVPTQTTTVSPSTGLTSNTAANVSKTAEKAQQQEADDKEEKSMALGMLSVEVVGFGSGSDDEQADKKTGLNCKKNKKCTG